MDDCLLHHRWRTKHLASQHGKLLWKQPEIPTADTNFHKFNTGMHKAFLSASDRCIISFAHKLRHNTAGLALNMTMQTTLVCFSTSLISPMTALFKEHHSFTRKLKNTSTNCPDPAKCLIIYNLFNTTRGINIDAPCLTSKKKKKLFINTSHRIFIGLQNSRAEKVLGTGRLIAAF